MCARRRGRSRGVVQCDTNDWHGPQRGFGLHRAARPAYARAGPGPRPPQPGASVAGAAPLGWVGALAEAQAPAELRPPQAASGLGAPARGLSRRLCPQCKQRDPCELGKGQPFHFTQASTLRGFKMSMRTRQSQAVSAIAAVLLFGAAIFVQAQNRENNRRTEQNQRTEQNRRTEQNQRSRAPAARAGEARRAQPQRAPRQVQRSSRERAGQEAQQRQVWQHHRLEPGRMPDNWGQRGGYRGEQIPSAYYRSHFGYQHRFRVYHYPFQVVAGVPRFQYEGYWFELAGPVPAYWGPDWYQSEDVYIVFAYGGYYLDNARFPNRPGVAVSVVF